MKICIYGPGAIGGHLAGRLAKGGAEVSVIARGAQLVAIRSRGLTVRTAEGDIHCQPQAAEHPAELGPQEAVVVCTKVPALPAVARAIAPLLDPDTPVTFVTNGIPWWYFASHGGPQDGARVPEVDPGDVVWNAIGPARASTPPARCPSPASSRSPARPAS
jgi:2-dehydropantoate 2-reductase